MIVFIIFFKVFALGMIFAIRISLIGNLIEVVNDL
jgi:hypothetical protein